jgi:hypothetical protein
MEFITVNAWPETVSRDYRSELEAGNVVYFPSTPFALSDESQEFLRSLDFAGKAIHKNIAYRPAGDRITGFAGPPEMQEHLLTVMRDYSRTVVKFTGELLPQYAAGWKLDYASFRPLEESSRDLPVNKRNDLLHTDAFPSRPTNGDLILRVFTNIHPSKTRNWITSDPFPVLADKYARSAGLDRIASGDLADRTTRFLHGLGLPVVARSPYDRFMLRFHEYLKRNADFQANCAKYRFNFPPGSSWLTFTDVLPHSVHSGQHALEQTFIISKATLAEPESAPVRVLERLCGRDLVVR